MGRLDAPLPDRAPAANLSAPGRAPTPPGTCHPLETNPKGDDFYDLRNLAMPRLRKADKEHQAARDVCTGYHDALAAAVAHLFQHDFGTLQAILADLREASDRLGGKGDKPAAERAFMAWHMFQIAFDHERTKASR